MKNKTDSLQRGGFAYAIASLMGIGLLWAWVYCCWFVVVPSVGGRATFVSADYAISIVCNIVVLIGYPVATRKSRREVGPRVQVGSAACVAVGTVFLGASMCYPDLALLSYVGAALTGVGAAMLWVAWAYVYAKSPIEPTEYAMALSVVLIPLLCKVVSVLPALVAIGVVACIPLAMLGCLRATQTSFGHDGARDLPPYEKADFKAQFLRICLVAVAVHCVIGTMLAVIPDGVAPLFFEFNSMRVVVAALLASAIALAVVTFAQRPDINTMYRWLLPVVAVGLVLIGFETTLGVAVGSTLVLVAQFGYTIALWTFFTRVAHAGWATPAICLAMTHGFAQLGLALGNLAGTAVMPLVAANACSVGNVAACCMCAATIFVVLFMGEESEFRLVERSDGATPTNASESGSSEVAAMPAGHETEKPKVQDTREAIAAPAPFDEKRAVSEFRRAYSLTDREEEVLVLLTQGRSVPYIQEKLYISKNTANSHVRHIYQKCGVHSKQELIEKFREM